MVLFFLPGGCAITCTPASRISSPVITSLAVPPPNSVGNMRPKCSLTWLKVLRQQVARLEVDLVDRVFERVDRLDQVGVLRVEEGLALARGRQLVERGQVDRAERGDLAVDAVDLALQARAASRRPPRCRLRQRLEVDLRPRQLLEVLRAAELRGLLLELQLGDALAQRLQAALDAPGAARRRGAAAASGRRTRCACAPSAASRSSLQRQRGLQAGLRGGVGQARQLVAAAASPTARWPRAAAPRSRWRAAARRAAPPARATRTAPPAPGAPARAAARAPRRACARRRSPRRRARRGAPAWSASCMSSSSKRASPVARRSSSSSSWRVDLGQFARRAGRAARCVCSASCVRRSSSTCSWCARVCASAGLAARAGQPLRGLGVGRLGAHQRAARLVGDQRLGAQLALEVLDLLRARQHAGLLGVGRVEG